MNTTPNVDALANFVGAVMGNHVAVSRHLLPDLDAPTTVRFLNEPPDGAVAVVQKRRRSATHLRSNELTQALATSLSNVAASGGGWVTLMHGDAIVAQHPVAPYPIQAIPSCSWGWLVIGLGLLLIVVALVGMVS